MKEGTPHEENTQPVVIKCFLVFLVARHKPPFCGLRTTPLARGIEAVE